MAVWKSICCPIDFSAVSSFALEEAAEHAWRSGGALTLLHVREAPPPSTGGTLSPLIIMGTHGRTGRERVPFGSVAQKVVLDAPCPVLVVHPRASRAAARPFTSGG